MEHDGTGESVSPRFWSRPSGLSNENGLEVPVSDLDRRKADHQLLQLLSEDQFRGSRYEIFENELARYAISVLKAWMYSGHIFTLVAGRGFGLSPHELDLERLHADGALREELATMTVALALPRFRQRALVEGGWTFEGGASIRTYFMGACLFCFPNEFRKHLAREAHDRRLLMLPENLDAILPSAPAVEDEILGRQRVRETIGDIDPNRLREKAVVALTVDGYTQEEIRDILDEQSVRAVEGLLHRWRKKAQRKERGECDEQGR
ncbi:RNA polymerase sigma factor [Streptomyces sp. NPDC057540]|uniref:RNA polymerase sigma factor n=1 Tax=Streptomyces sp. NPDC057540 TaxID=3346160 RepID=UPI0036768C61